MPGPREGSAAARSADRCIPRAPARSYALRSLPAASSLVELVGRVPIRRRSQANEVRGDDAQPLLELAKLDREALHQVLDLAHVAAAALELARVALHDLVGGGRGEDRRVVLARGQV